MTTTQSAIENIRKYSNNDLLNSIDLDRWAVRDEAARRHALAVARLAKLQREIAELENIHAKAQ